MTADTGFDEHGFYSPTPITHAARRIPRNDFPTGPMIGAAIPEVRLNDQNGELVDVLDRLGPKGAVISFQRSAFW